MLINMKFTKHKEPEVPEELKPTSISFKSAFWVALAIHALIGVSFAASPIISAKAKESKKQHIEDKKALEEPMPVFVGVPEATPTPAPVVVTQPTPKQNKSDDWPRTKVEPVKKNTDLTKEYIVKPGDTFYSIVKKYKLNPVKLQQLNKITDTNKITVGQRLLFF